jgi:flagellar hook-associated protein FlgK
MTVEAAGFIDDIDPTQPPGTDNFSEGDNHLRNFKKSVQDSLPNISGAMTATHAELNTIDGYTGTTADFNILSGASAAGLTAAELQYVKGVTSDIQAQLNSKGDGDLNASNNLSDVASAPTSRSNLGLKALAILDSVAAGQIDADSVNHSEISFGSNVGTTAINSGVQTISEGFWWVYEPVGITLLQINLGGGWRTVSQIDSPAFCYSDGTNMRFNTDGSYDVHYRRLG